MAGYQTTGFTVAASDLGATHRRERLFLIAYLDHGQRHHPQRWQDEVRRQAQKVRHHTPWLSVKPRSHGQLHGFSLGLIHAHHWAEAHPDFYLVPNGLRRRNDVRRLAGKSLTPAQATIALHFIHWHSQEKTRQATG